MSDAERGKAAGSARGPRKEQPRAGAESLQQLLDHHADRSFVERFVQGHRRAVEMFQRRRERECDGLEE